MTVVGGVLLAVFVEFLRGQIERRQRRQDQREEFERETIIELQETLHRMHDEGISLKLRINAVLNRASDSNTPTDDFESPELADAIIRVKTLAVRTKDKEMRNHVRQLIAELGLMLESANSAHEVDAAWGRVADTHNRTNERIGQLLRDET
jgi:hypothetical protein